MTVKKRATVNHTKLFDAVEALSGENHHPRRPGAAAAQKKRKLLQQSKAAQSQTAIYASLLECRILMQRALSAVSNKASATTENRSAVDSSVDELLIQLLRARQLLLQKTNKAETSDKKYNHQEIHNPDKLQAKLQSEYQTCRHDWQTVLDKRHKDVKLHAGIILAHKQQQTFRVMDNTFWQQVDATVQHEQLRQQYQQQQQQNQVVLFDDSKLYQQLLKDFVTTAAAATSGIDQEQLAKQRLQKQSTANNNNNKNAVDRKASKGRKIRYHEIPKLVHFTFPLHRRTAATHSSSSGFVLLDQDEWFKSLFGGAAYNNKTTTK